MQYTGDVQYTGDIMSTPAGYHDKYGGRSLGKQLNLYGSPGVLNIPGGLLISPHTQYGIPQCTHGIPSVLNDARRTHAILPVYCTDVM